MAHWRGRTPDGCASRLFAPAVFVRIIKRRRYSHVDVADDDLTQKDMLVIGIGLVLTGLVAVMVDPYITVLWSGPSINWPLVCSSSSRGCEPMILESMLRAVVGTSVGIIPLIGWRWRRSPEY